MDGRLSLRRLVRHCGVGQAASAAGAGRGSTGRRIVKRVPFPGALTQFKVPAWRSIVARASANPCPVPLPTSLVVKNGS